MANSDGVAEDGGKRLRMEKGLRLEKTRLNPPVGTCTAWEPLERARSQLGRALLLPALLSPSGGATDSLGIGQCVRKGCKNAPSGMLRSFAKSAVAKWPQPNFR